MQIFTNGKRRFYSFMEFYVIHLKYQGVKSVVPFCPQKWLGERVELTYVISERNSF